MDDDDYRQFPKVCTVCGLGEHVGKLIYEGKGFYYHKRCQESDAKERARESAKGN